jgi:hypothetical protein
VNRVARHAAWLVVAYGAAVAASSLLTIVLSALAVIASSPKDGLDILRMVPLVLLQGALITCLTALPGWLLAVALSETFNEHRRGFYLVAGGMTALFAHALLAYSTGSGRDLALLGTFGPVVPASIPSGVLGGWLHWRIAGKQAGGWRA